ncbi:MAG TPA: hypothetical protein VGI00_07115 [Streptosporangiaceae bacterium]|jgi:hypothetical protein
MVTAPAGVKPDGVEVDAGLGGRWTSLVISGREWLWSRPEPLRAEAVPGVVFADAGGIEECIPTVRGRPDHGDAWSRPWRPEPGDQGRAENFNILKVAGPSFQLSRGFHVVAGGIVAAYRLTADPGFRFVWAAHALLALSGQATLAVPAGTKLRLYPEAAPFLADPWPTGAPFVEHPWPGPGDLRLDRVGGDPGLDGSAVGAIALDCPDTLVTDGGSQLKFRLCGPVGAPVSTAIWRNLGGFPPDRPYRSTGVEPMLGAVFDLAEARSPADAVTVPASGEVTWELTITGAGAA